MAVEFVAEVGANHGRDWARAEALAAGCAAAGFGWLKFQAFQVDRVFRPEAVAARPDLRDRRAADLPEEWLGRLPGLARDHGLGLMVTFYDPEWCGRYARLCDAVKVSSYDVRNHKLLTVVARQGRPVYLSAGMAHPHEVELALGELGAAGLRDVTLLACRSRYPCPPGEANLAAVARLREVWGRPVGWSDHTGRPGVVERAVHRWGASVVELHVDLDDLLGFEQGPHVWPMVRASVAIDLIREGLAADGDGRIGPDEAEIPERKWRADPTDGLRPERNISTKETEL